MHPQPRMASAGSAVTDRREWRVMWGDLVFVTIMFRTRRGFSPVQSFRVALGFPR